MRLGCVISFFPFAVCCFPSYPLNSQQPATGLKLTRARRSLVTQTLIRNHHRVPWENPQGDNTVENSNNNNNKYPWSKALFSQPGTSIHRLDAKRKRQDLFDQISSLYEALIVLTIQLLLVKQAPSMKSPTNGAPVAPFSVKEACNRYWSVSKMPATATGRCQRYLHRCWSVSELPATGTGQCQRCLQQVLVSVKDTCNRYWSVSEIPVTGTLVSSKRYRQQASWSVSEMPATCTGKCQRYLQEVSWSVSDWSLILKDKDFRQKLSLTICPC